MGLLRQADPVIDESLHEPVSDFQCAKLQLFLSATKLFMLSVRNIMKKSRRWGICRKMVTFMTAKYILAYAAVGDRSGAVGEPEGDYAYAGCWGCIMDRLGGGVKRGAGGDDVIDEKDMFVL